MATHTPGPWTWREDEFRSKYMVRMRNGNWRAKPGQRVNNSWVILLTGPALDPAIPPQHMDEWDYPHVLALRWASVRGTGLVNLGPSLADARLIAAAPELLAALVAVLHAHVQTDEDGMFCCFCDQMLPSGEIPAAAHHEDDCPMPQVIAAIAKARGE